MRGFAASIKQGTLEGKLFPVNEALTLYTSVLPEMEVIMEMGFP